MIGLDEAGRGSWAGPLTVAAVWLTKDIPGLADSKKLTAKQRRDLAREIQQKAEYISLAWVSNTDIDDMGLARAVELAFKLAHSRMPLGPAIIDGNISYIPGVEAVIRADSKYACVSAASIIAKHFRDRYMINISSKYPKYQLDRHKGYGTALHKSLLQELGPSSIHRYSYAPVKELKYGSS